MNVQRILEGISRLRVLVVGDICLDRWCTYDRKLAEQSRETGIPRIAVVETETTPGAGGTVANNLAALGAREVAVLGAVGEDGFAWELKAAMSTRGIAPDLLIADRRMCTFTYTKLINKDTGLEDLPRVDYVNTQDPAEDLDHQLIDRFDCHARDFDVVIVSDQAETERGGVVSAGLRERISELAQQRSNVVWVDSRMRPEMFHHVVLKPNRAEAEAACRRLCGSVDLQRFYRQNDLRLLVVTDGERGAVLVNDQGEQPVPARQVQAVDICGAGDSFSAGAACALAITGSPLEAAQFGNLVASVTVTKKGTGTASPQELLAI